MVCNSNIVGLKLPSQDDPSRTCSGAVPELFGDWSWDQDHFCDC